jgi:hypothetical protein
MEYAKQFCRFQVFRTIFIPNLVVGAESTYSYYCLYDACKEAGIPFYLGHALYMKALSVNKKKSYHRDSGILPS